VSKRVIKLNLRAHVHGHHQRARNAISKATRGVNVDLSNLLYIKISTNLIMWVVSYRTENLARLGGVRSSVVEHVTTYPLSSRSAKVF
jgi:hypothetical protein